MNLKFIFLLLGFLSFKVITFSQDLDSIYNSYLMEMPRSFMVDDNFKDYTDHSLIVDSRGVLNGISLLYNDKIINLIIVYFWSGGGAVNPYDSSTWDFDDITLNMITQIQVDYFDDTVSKKFGEDVIPSYNLSKSLSGVFQSYLGKSVGDFIKDPNFNDFSDQSREHEPPGVLNGIILIYNNDMIVVTLYLKRIHSLDDFDNVEFAQLQSQIIRAIEVSDAYSNLVGRWEIKE